MTTILIASDHAGFKLKNYLIDVLTKRGYTIDDMGPKNYDPNDDYPDHIKPLAGKIDNNNFGIVICRNGVGVSIQANRSRKVCCALSWGVDHIKSARNDDNVNVLALPADYVNKETALAIALTFVETPFSGEERHTRRIRKIDDYTRDL